MDEKLIREIEREAADALLDTGVSIPVMKLKLPFRASPIIVRLTMKRPCMSGQIAIARTYLDMGVTSKDMWEFDKEQEMQFLTKHGKAISRMIALTLCRGFLSRKFLTRVTSYMVRNFMPYEYMLEAVRKFILLMGTDPFIGIIRSVEMVNPMKPRLSHKKKGS